MSGVPTLLTRRLVGNVLYRTGSAPYRTNDRERTDLPVDPRAVSPFPYGTEVYLAPLGHCRTLTPTRTSPPSHPLPRG